MTDPDRELLLARGHPEDALVGVRESVRAADGRVPAGAGSGALAVRSAVRLGHARRPERTEGGLAGLCNRNACRNPSVG